MFWRRRILAVYGDGGMTKVKSNCRCRQMSLLPALAICLVTLVLSYSLTYGQGDSTGDPTCDAFIVYDLGRMDLAQIADTDNGNWCVGETQGNPNHLEGYLKKDPRSNVYVPDSSRGIHAYGQITVLTVLSGHPRRQVWKYVLQNPGVGWLGMHPYDTYEDLRIEGDHLVVCRLPNSESDSDSRPNPVYWIPDAWKAFLISALNDARLAAQRRAVVPGSMASNPPLSPPDKALGFVDNPYFEIASFRALASSGGLTSYIAGAEIAKAHGMERAVLVNLAIASKAAGVKGLLAARIDGAPSAAELRWLALGAFTSADFDLLGDIEKRHLELQDTGPDGKYVDRLIARARALPQPLSLKRLTPPK